MFKLLNIYLNFKIIDVKIAVSKQFGDGENSAQVLEKLDEILECERQVEK